MFLDEVVKRFKNRLCGGPGGCPPRRVLPAITEAGFALNPPSVRPAQDQAGIVPAEAERL
jgi:hypothetical protein